MLGDAAPRRDGDSAAYRRGSASSRGDASGENEGQALTPLPVVPGDDAFSDLEDVATTPARFGHCVHSHDEREATARLRVRASIEEQANNPERAVVRGDAERLRVCTVWVGSSSQEDLHLRCVSALRRRNQLGGRRGHVRLSSGDRWRVRRRWKPRHHSSVFTQSSEDSRGQRTAEDSS